MTADEALERAAQMLERRSGNEQYMKAWKVAAKLIRSMKKVNRQSETNHIHADTTGSR